MKPLAGVPSECRSEHQHNHERLQTPIALIRAEQEGVLQRFHEIEKGATCEETYVRLVQQLCDRLTAYLALKEDVVIPTVRGLCLNRARKSQIEESIVEHFCLKILLETLDGEGPEDDLFAAKLAVLQRYFIRHIGFEQRFLFPLLVSFTPVELVNRILAHKSRLDHELQNIQ